VALTFDDGYAHSADLLAELVAEYHASPAVFVPTAWIGKANRWDYSYYFRHTPHLSRDDIRRLGALGVQFGSHGHRHLDLTALDDDRLADELARSKKTLEDLTGREVDAISYPFSRCDQRVIAAAARAGYRLGFTMAFPGEADSPLALGRYAVYFWDNRRSIVGKLRQGRGYRLRRTWDRMVNRLSTGTVLLNRVRRPSA
jgi:peptidoglycan/xylan/chitin deacetylase (PgdA/CDA1 family)